MSDLGNRWRQIQGTALYAYSRLVTRTARFRVEGWEQMEAAEASGRPVLWAMWHGQLMGFVSFGDRFLENEDFVAVMVGDERGDTLGMFARRLRGRVFRVDMGGNPFAAGRAVLRVIQEMKAGRQSIIAPDGPDGPAFVPKPGVAFLARKAGAVILPLGVWTRQAYQLRRWDRYLVPTPFAHFHVKIGQPLPAEPQMERETLLVQIEEVLHAARERAMVLAGARPWR
ncbi:MAG: hypothetical protein R3248_14265 [Candidatus Promineifilaceae bacterium]|nr:hypothetical protein [Candidatus Promineifilaceae bacterium]